MSPPAKSTLLTPHEGEKIYSANDISPDGKTRADHFKCRQRIRQRRPARHRHQENHLAHPRQVGNRGRQASRLTASTSPGPRTSTATPKSIFTTLASGKTNALPLPKGLNASGGSDTAFTSRRRAPALLPQRSERAQRCMGLLARRWQVATGHALRCRWHSRGRTWSNRCSCTIRAKTASGRSPPSSTCLTTCRAMDSTRRSSTCTAVRLRRP